MVPYPSPAFGPGETRIRIDAFGLSANNVTYAVFGDLLRYWECFPGPEDERRVVGPDPRLGVR